MWKEEGWVKELSSQYRLVLVDLRGHGYSTNPSNTFTHRQAAEDTYAMLDILGIKTFKAIGFSSGGMILTHMAVIDTGRIEAMILMGSTSYSPDQARTLQRSVSYNTASEDWMKDLRRWHPRGESQIKSLLSQFSNFAASYNDVNFTPSYLSKITAATLLIHGDRDSFFPVEMPVTSFQHIPKSYLWIIPNFGHGSIATDSMWGATLRKAIYQFFSGKWNN